MAVWTRLLPVWGLWLGVGVGSAPLTVPVDGGSPLHFVPAAEDSWYEGDPCTRRERGGWHHSTVHCHRMTPAKLMSGVWVTAFEEATFIPDERTVPAPDDPRRFGDEIELDSETALQLAGNPRGSGHADAFLLTFVGRRTFDPWFDCYGMPHFLYVVEQLHTARYVGPVKAMRPRWWESWQPPPLRRYAGRWGKMQAESMAECRNRPPLGR